MSSAQRKAHATSLWCQKENENFIVTSQASSSMTGIGVGGRRWKDNLPGMCLEDQVDSHSSFLASSGFIIVIVALVLTQLGLCLFSSHQRATCLLLSEQPQMD